MTSTKAAATKATVSKLETSAIDNVISVAQWAETTAIARDGIFKCVRDLAEISRVTTQAMIGGIADYSNEIRDISSICAATMVSGLNEAGRPLMVEGASPVKIEAGVSDMMKQFQRLIDANSRLAERQINAASEACQALSAIPACILGSLDSK